MKGKKRGFRDVEKGHSLDLEDNKKPVKKNKKEEVKDNGTSAT